MSDLITWQPSIGSQREKERLSKLWINPSLVNETLLAIDIGNKGGLCWNDGSSVGFLEMPYDTKENPNPRLVNEKWEAINGVMPSTIVAENVHAFEGQGIVSTGTLLKNRGQVEMAAAATGAEMILIQPLAWISCYTMKRKKHFKRTKEEIAAKMPTWKQHLAEIAMAILPAGYDLSLVNERTADAILIWNYWASVMTGNQLPKMGSQLVFK